MRFEELLLQELLRDKRLGFIERSLYLWAYQRTHPSLSALAKAVGLSWKAVAKACDRLEAAGWLRTERAPQARRPIAVVPASCQVALAQLLETRYAHAPHKGEFLMRAYLDALVDCEDYIDNARVEHLTNPASSKPMEYDRYYPGLKVGFEFNGASHHPPTAADPAADAAYRETRTRDLVKDALSREAGFGLVVITATDLHPETFEARLPQHLPRRHVDQAGAYYTTLGKIGARYAERSLRSKR